MPVSNPSPELPEAQAGAIELDNNAAEASHTGQVYTKKKETMIGRAGIYTVTFEMKSSCNDASAYGRVYKDGVAHGTERVSPSETYIEYSEDLAFSRGDPAQLYTKVELVDTRQVTIKNFKLKANIPIVPKQVLT